MSTFKLEFNCDNAAFADDPSVEVGRILREVARKVDGGHIHNRVMDVNGNCVGDWSMEIDESEKEHDLAEDWRHGRD